MKLEINSIAKTYNGQTEALKEFSFSVEKNQFISVIGSSGSGKTTLLHMINGALAPDTGSVSLDGQELSAMKGKQRRRVQKKIAVIYQDFRLVEPVSCIENVLNACLADMNPITGSLGLFTKDQRSEALQLLERVGLKDKPEELVKNLSGGQKQRVAIARALMQHPALLLADEPIASLDPVTGRQILSLLRDICDKEGITVIMNSHNPQLSAEFSDRILGLRRGRLIFDGEPSQLTSAELDRIYEGSEAPHE